MSAEAGFLLVGAFWGLMAGTGLGIWLAERRVRWIAKAVGSQSGRGPAALDAADEIVRCMESNDWYAAVGGGTR